MSLISWLFAKEPTPEVNICKGCDNRAYCESRSHQERLTLYLFSLNCPLRKERSRMEYK